MNDSTPNPLRILYIAGSPDDEQAITRQLEQGGLKADLQRVDNETDFIAALALTPGLILSDYSSPQLDGLQALKTLKEHQPNIPFILISDVPGEETAVDSIKQGADDYLMTDRLERLSSAVQRALKQKPEQDTQHSLKESNTLTQIGRALSETERVGTDKVLQLIVNSVRELIQHAEESVIHLMDAEKDELFPRAVSGIDEGTKALDRPKLRLGEGVARQVIQTGKTINVGDINSSPLFIQRDQPPTFRTLMVALVQSGKQQIGTISVQSNKLNAFSAHDMEGCNALMHICPNPLTFRILWTR